jgi:hypothetical protein
MSTRAFAVIALVCGLAACTTAATDPPAGRAPAPVSATVMEMAATVDQAPAVVARAVIAPTPEMLKAAMSNDPDAMREAVVATSGTCQAAVTCPSQFGSCSGWSTPTTCDQTCGASFCLCRPIRLCEGDPPEPRGTQTINSFRVCFDANQNACTEWTNTTTSFCGC